MKEELEKAIIAAAKKAAASVHPEEAVKYTQAALNAAHALATLFNMK